jgi:putative endonuclease
VIQAVPQRTPSRVELVFIPRRPYYVYIVASVSRTIYVGVTNDLARRMHEHHTKAADGFTAKYNVNRLVWYEVTGNVSAAIAREKQIKSYSRKKKIDLIEAENAGWRDLAEELGLLPPDTDGRGTTGH